MRPFAVVHIVITFVIINCTVAFNKFLWQSMRLQTSINTRKTIIPTVDYVAHIAFAVLTHILKFRLYVSLWLK